jgi:hypothetical protein
MMISTFLDESYANPQNSIVIQNQLSLMSDDSDANFNETERSNTAGSKNQDLLNHYLSWFYVQQKVLEVLYSGPSINATQNHFLILSI